VRAAFNSKVRTKVLHIRCSEVRRGFREENRKERGPGGGETKGPWGCRRVTQKLWQSSSGTKRDRGNLGSWGGRKRAEEEIAARDTVDLY